MKKILPITIAIIIAVILFKVIGVIFAFAWSLTMLLLKVVVVAIFAIPAYFYFKSKLLK